MAEIGQRHSPTSASRAPGTLRVPYRDLEIMEREGFGLRYSASLPTGKRVCKALGTGFVFLPAPKPEQKKVAEMCVGVCV